jgi:hypothetical protein
VFLLYYFIRLLEDGRPTAIQLDKDRFYLFDEQGASVFSTVDRPERLEACVALADSNESVYQPCTPFLRQAKFVVQAASAQPVRIKDWSKGLKRETIIANPPKELEIMAIV